MCRPPSPRSTTSMCPSIRVLTRLWKLARMDRSCESPSSFRCCRVRIVGIRSSEDVQPSVFCGCQLTTQPPVRLLGQTGLGQQPSIMSSFTVVVSPVQAVVYGSSFGQSLTKITYSFPQTMQSQVCLSHIGRVRQEASTELKMLVVGVLAKGFLCIVDEGLTSCMEGE